MYEIFCDEKLLYTPNEQDVALISATLSLEMSNAGSFTFSMPAIHPLYDSVVKFKTVIEVKSDGESIFRGRVVEETLDIFKSKTVYCEGDLALLNDSIQRPSESHDITVRQFLEMLINNHNAQVEDSKKFRVGAVSVTDTNNSLYRYTNYENTLTAIKEKLVSKLGGYISLRYENGERIIDYLAENSDVCSQTIQFGENLLDYSSNINATDIATRLIPLGARLDDSQYTAIEERVTIKDVNGGLDYLQSNEAIERYGIITKIQKWDDVNVPSILKTKGQEYLESVQWENMVLNVTAVDMHLLNADIEEIHVGDNILCVSEVHGLRKMFPVQRMDIDLMNPANNRIQLGTKGDISISAKSNSTEYIANEANTEPTSAILQSAKANATSLITRATNGYIVLHMNRNGNPDELLIMDTPDITTATKVWRWNVNGLGYSNTGYNGQYGLAMTMDGAIVADRVTTGTMSADRIYGGTINGNNVSVTNINANNITSGTISGDKVTGGTIQGVSLVTNNATITGGSININTTSASQDKITLAYGDQKVILSPSQISFQDANRRESTFVQQGGVYSTNFGIRYVEGSRLITVSGWSGNIKSADGTTLKVRNGLITAV